MIAAYCNGELIAALPLASRAAHYGDGAFTTLRVHAGRVCWWPRHRARLDQACAALHLIPPDWRELESQLAGEAGRRGTAIFKVMLVPQGQGRGYARPWPSACDVFVFVHAVPGVAPGDYREGIALEFAAQAIADGEALGVKSMSRLAQVQASAAGQTRQVLCCDRDGFVMGAQSANLFALYGSVWITPPAGQGVIAGVTRATLLQSPPPGFSARVQAMHRDALLHADALILTNAVRGILPVATLAGREFKAHDAVHALMRRVHPELGLPEP